MKHIESRHPELIMFRKEFEETIFRPEKLIRKTTGELLLVRWDSNIFNGKYLVVVIKADTIRPWIITSFVSRKMPVGENYET